MLCERLARFAESVGKMLSLRLGKRLVESLDESLSERFNMTNCTVDDFKAHLDNILTMVPDEPDVSGCEYTSEASDQYTGKIIDQLPEKYRRKKIRWRKSAPFYFQIFIFLNCMKFPLTPMESLYLVS